MLPETVDPTESLLNSEYQPLNLVRWNHQCETLKCYYDAAQVFAFQQIDIGFEIICSAHHELLHFTPGVIFPAELSLLQHIIQSQPTGLTQDLTQLTLDETPRDFDGIQHILSRPITWPDGSIFGGICVLNPQKNTDFEDLSMLEPFQIMLQQELALFCQSHRIDSLSMRDRNTGMLNNYGFIMMAPRLLSLGRRFGAHAGIMIFELSGIKNPQQPLEEKHHRLLGNIIQNTVRTADVTARYNDTQFVVLVFIDAERDLQHIVRRIEKQLEQQNELLSLDHGHSFFTPESTATIAPMIEEARSHLTSQSSKKNNSTPETPK